MASLWWLMAGGAIILELLSGTFYLLMLALGLAAGALAAHAGLELAWQFVAAAVVGGCTVLAWHLAARRQRSTPVAPSANPDLNLDIGQRVHVTDWQADGSTRLHHRGTEWSAQLAQPEANPAPGPYRIVAVRGSVLVLAKPENPSPTES